jgi:hypothetical protein
MSSSSRSRPARASTRRTPQRSRCRKRDSITRSLKRPGRDHQPIRPGGIAFFTTARAALGWSVVGRVPAREGEGSERPTSSPSRPPRCAHSTVVSDRAALAPCPPRRASRPTLTWHGFSSSRATWRARSGCRGTLALTGELRVSVDGSASDRRGLPYPPARRSLVRVCGPGRVGPRR